MSLTKVSICLHQLDVNNYNREFFSLFFLRIAEYSWLISVFHHVCYKILQNSFWRCKLIKCFIIKTATQQCGKKETKNDSTGITG